MYGKLFETMYHGTLGSKGPWQALVTFQQLIILSDRKGIVDMTPESISRMTTIPLEIIQSGIKTLLKPDPDSRTPDEEGRRIVALDDCRDWGWRIVNYEKYREICSEDERRDYMRNYQRKRRANVNSVNSQLTPVNNVKDKLAVLTHADAEADADVEALRVRGRASALPPTFELNEKRTEYAKSKGIVNPAEEFEHFKNHHTAKGSTFKNWDAAWRTWCQNSQRFGGKRNEQTRRLSAVEIVRNATAERAKARGETK